MWTNRSIAFDEHSRTWLHCNKRRRTCRHMCLCGNSLYSVNAALIDGTASSVYIHTYLHTYIYKTCWYYYYYYIMHRIRIKLFTFFSWPLPPLTMPPPPNSKQVHRKCRKTFGHDRVNVRVEGMTTLARTLT